MYNPYKMLGVNKDASNSEILKTYEYKVNTLCKNNNSLKNFFTKACNDLLDSEKRKEIDSILFKEENYDIEQRETINLHIENTSDKLDKISINPKESIPKTIESTDIKTSNLKIGDMPSVKSQSIFVTYVVKELNKLKDTYSLSKSSLFERTIPLRSIFAVIGIDNSFMFVEEKCYKDVLNQYYYYLNHIFTNTPYTKEYESAKRPWKNNQIFNIYGIKSVVMLGTKFIPSTKITDNATISYNYLKNLEVEINRALSQDMDIISNLFKEEQKTK